MGSANPQGAGSHPASMIQAAAQDTGKTGCHDASRSQAAQQPRTSQRTRHDGRRVEGKQIAEGLFREAYLGNVDVGRSPMNAKCGSTMMDSIKA